MPLTSMTGFARAEGEQDTVRWHWEVRSVNGKGFDLRMRLPQGFEGLEPEVRALVSKYVRRGNCQLSLQVSRTQQSGELRVNQTALQNVLDAMAGIAPRFDVSPPSLDGIFAIRGVVEIQEPEEPDDVAARRNVVILKDLETALKALSDMRNAEGERLRQVMSGQIDTIERLARAAEDCPARKPEAIRARLKEQVERIMEQSSGLDEDRLHQEAILISAKVDIQEELDRLIAHVAAARELLGEDDAVGRRFDFLTQEFNREANTLCSKSNAPELTTIGLDLKAVIDQLREQVQNIE